MGDGCRRSGGETNPACPLSRSRRRFPGVKNGKKPTPKHTPRCIPAAAAHRKDGEEERRRMGMEAEAPAGGMGQRDWTDGRTGVTGEADTAREIQRDPKEEPLVSRRAPRRGERSPIKTPAASLIRQVLHFFPNWLISSPPSPSPSSETGGGSEIGCSNAT